MVNNNDDDKNDLILHEVRGVSAAVTSLTRHVDRMDERLGSMDERLGRVESSVAEVKADVSEVKTDVKFIKEAVSEQSADLDDHERRMKYLEKKAA